MYSLSRQCGCMSSMRIACRLLINLFVITLMAFLAVDSVSALSNVVTYHYDISRSGLNANEVTLTPANVNSGQFGKLFSHTVDGPVYPQPLYVENLIIPDQGIHNVVFVATDNDTVYAFDADSNADSNASPLWSVSLIDTAHGAAPGATAVAGTDIDCLDTFASGVTGTPVIDTTTGTMYLDATSKENGAIVHRLHALDITTGAEKAPGPILVKPTVGSTNFDPAKEHQKAGLLLVNGTLFVAFGSHCDANPFHGWLVAYDVATFTQKAAFNSTPNSSVGGGIWMS